MITCLQVFPWTRHFLQPKYHWVVETTSFEDIHTQFSGLDLPIVSNVLAFNGSGSLVALYDVYRPAPHHTLR